MTRVIKIGGRPQADPALPGLLAAAAAGGEGLVVVHGGGDEVSALQSAMGATPTFVGGRRVTGEQDIAIIRMALSGVANKRLVTALVREGVRALGLSGEDASLIAAEPLGGALGLVGAPARINVDLLQHLTDGGYVPVVSPVSASTHGNGVALNVNGDDAAAAIAVALAAEELLLVSDVPGVRVDADTVAMLEEPVARRMIADGSAAGGMGPKLQAALAALDGGVARVRIGNLAAVGDPTRGTIISKDGVLT